MATITLESYVQHGNFGENTFLHRFGSWNNALEAGELSLSNRVNVPNEELFENLANVWLALGRQPVGKDISKSIGTSKFSIGTYEKRFGSWNKALCLFVECIQNPNAEIILNEPGSDQKSQVSLQRTQRKINWRLRAKVLIRDNCICLMCGTSPAKDSSVTLHVDHIKPWSKGGETLIENLQTLCSVCNIGKSDEIFDEKDEVLI